MVTTHWVSLCIFWFCLVWTEGSELCACNGKSHGRGAIGTKCARWDAPDERPWCYVDADACGADTFESRKGVYWAQRPCSKVSAAELNRAKTGAELAGGAGGAPAASAASAASASAESEPWRRGKADRKKKGCELTMPWVDLFDHIHVAPTQKGKPRILCSIYTNSEDGSIYKAQGESKPRDPYQRAQWLTWGNKCDRFIFWTDAPLKNGLPYRVVKTPGGESYYNMWAKVRTIWSTIAEEYAKDYDYFTMGGDDNYLVLENLRKYLLSDEIKSANDAGEALYLGRRMHGGTSHHGVFNTGGAQYVMNKKALGTLMDGLRKGHCRPDAQTHEEDVKVACVLREAGVHPRDTAAADGNRFSPLSAEATFIYKIGSWGPHGWFDVYQHPLYGGKEQYEAKFPCCGIKCCSKDFVSIHYMDQGGMLEAFNLMHYCRGDPKYSEPLHRDSPLPPVPKDWK